MELATAEQDRDEVVPQALWPSALVAYARCFGKGSRFGLATEEPPTGFEPVTYALREARYTALGTLPAQIGALAPGNALNAQRALESRATIRPRPR
jgi:hypothetical protein